MSLISMNNVSVAYDKSMILHGINLSISDGEIVTVVGPNGSGKSTLLRAMIGALPLASGKITKRADLKIGYLPQHLMMDPSLPMSVGRFLALSGSKVSQSKICHALRESGVLGLKHQQLSQLSGGQFQRVMLAHAVIEGPEVLLLDEPTQGLDQPASAAFYRRISELRDTLGCAVVMVSHELHVVMAASDRVICLNGHICCEGLPEVVAEAPAYRALFGSGTGGALALYRHEHSHSHDADCNDVNELQKANHNDTT
ncbi:MAG: metal ABC transporter ATP-binding protein [Planktomarina sp.]|nr:metal ABC transporter ATP-binding protein [Planktomarina sp.]